MNWAWAASLDQLWRSPTFPMWLTLAVVGFFGICVFVTLLRAEKSIANVALTVITLLALGMAAADTIRGFSPVQPGVSAGAGSALQHASATLPALSCIDDLAGDVVLAACEKTLFGSAENAAAALSYAASQLTRLTASGDVAAANRSMTPELEILRRSVERDRYGLMAQVLVTRDHCSPSECAVFRALTDHQQIAANMAEGVYDSLIARYAPSWNTAPPGAAPPVAMLSPSMPTGKPTNAEFPSASSTPPVSIMTPEPSATSSTSPPRPAASSTPPPTSAASPPSRPAASAPPAVAAAKKPAAPKHVASPPQHTPAPVQLTPAPGAPAPEASND
jgi:hypothetical protein